MNYHDIKKCDMLNGDGIRVSLWVSGCNHNCNQCQNPQTWNVNNGIPFDKDAEKELFEALEKNYISGITFTGGDPLHENNLECVLNLVNKIRLLLPEKTIWLYTGYTLTECLLHPIRQKVVSNCDIIVDGRYVDELKDITLKWRGSSNQKIWEKRNGEWSIYKMGAVYGQES